MIDPNIPKLVLEGDTLETLRQNSFDRIRAASGNLLNDFREGSPLAALVEGQVFALSELLYYANLLPEATALELFRLYGVERSLGTYAAGDLVFQLNSTQNIPFSLPVGYAMGYKGANLVLSTPLFIPAGASRATAGVVCDQVGSAYNAESYGVLITSTGQSRLQTVYNDKPLTGGSDLEPIPDCIARMQRQINTRQTCITQSDFELAAQDYLGVGSRAIAVPQLSRDLSTLVFGNAAVFLLDKDGVPVSLENARQVQIDLQERAVIGMAVWCFPMPLYEVSAELFIQVETIDEAISYSIIDRARAYLSPNTYNGGYKIRYHELAYIARDVFGCVSVESVLLNGESMDLLLPNTYTLPKPTTIVVHQVSKTGQVLETSVTVDYEEIFD